MIARRPAMISPMRWAGAADLLSEAVLEELHRHEKLLEQELPRGDRLERDIGGLGLVIVDDLDVRRAGGGPAEADAVLIVDADAVLPGANHP